MPRATFAELYCARHNLTPAAYTEAVFREALYPHARPFVGLIRFFAEDYFAADLDLVRAAGLLRAVGDFNMDVEEFRHHPANCGVLRHGWRLRVSTQRLREIIRETIPLERSARDRRSGPDTQLAGPLPR